MIKNIHSSNVEIEVNINQEEPFYLDSIFYFERNNMNNINGFFEVNACRSDQFNKAIAKRKMCSFFLVLPNDEVIDAIENVYIYKQEFINPEYGSVICRYYFSTKANSEWTASQELINSLAYKDNKIFDYATADRIKELTEVFVEWKVDCSSNSGTVINK